VSRDRLRTSLCAAGALAGTLALGALLPASAVATPAEVRDELRAAEAPVTSLGLDDRVPLAGDASVYRYQQTSGGVPVEGGEAIVLDSGDDGADLVADDTEVGLDAPDGASVSRKAAVRAAVASVGADGLTSRPRAELVVEPGGDGTLAWRVTVAPTRPLGEFEVLVDASSGAVLEQHDLAWRASGQARIFLPNAVVENDGYGVYGDPPGTFPISNNRDRDSTELTNLRSQVTLLRLNDGRPCLKGENAEARFGRKAKRVCRDSRDWSGVTRAAERFEAVMAYHHVDQAQDYLDEIGAPAVEDKRQLVVANAFGADQSFYMPGGDVVKLGSGGVDDGEDGDVIVHEFGHAVQDTQRPGFGDSNHKQAEAIGEAFGDYFAAAVSEERWLTSGEFSLCIMEWDAVSYDFEDSPDDPGICLRRVDVDRDIGEQRSFCGGRRDFHCVGQAWSSALWDLRVQLGEESGLSVMDRVVLESQPMYSRRTKFSAAARALIAADELLYGAGDHCVEIRAEMLDREFLGAADAPTC
jgi:hypothetical protein